MHTAKLPQISPAARRRLFTRSNAALTPADLPGATGEGTLAPSIKPGMTIDRKYVILERIGAGGFGTVYLVEHTFLGQRFALKLLDHEISSDLAWVERFHREARATSLIGHEGIVFVTDFGYAEGVGYYFVMEHLPGGTLDFHMVNSPPMEVARVVRFALTISSALAAVHELGIVHCDLKPSNLILTQQRNGTEAVKILDFGVSSHVTANQEGIFGTPYYMSPEQTLSMKVTDRADQFSLAVILYEMLTGHRPWEIERWEDATPWMRERHPPKPPSFYMEDGSDELDGVILRALEVDPVRRWQDIQSFAWGLAMASEVEWSALPDPWDSAGSTVAPHRRPTSLSKRHPPLATVVEVADPAEGAETMMVYVDEFGGSSLDCSAGSESTVEEMPLFDGPVLSVHFRTSERLRREWRRNLLGGALFVQCEVALANNERVGVRLIYEPLGRDLFVEGVVSGVLDNGDTSGASISIADAFRGQLYAFIKSLKLGFGYKAEDVVMPLRSLCPDDDLAVEEAFLFSRIFGPTTVASARQLSIGLSIEADHVLDSLVQKGLLLVKPRGLKGRPQREQEPPVAWLSSNMRTQRVRARSSQTREAIEETLAKVEFFISVRNYLAAINILYKSLEIYPTEAQLYYRLGMLYAQFEQDFERAQQLLENAVRLDPVERRYHMALEYLDTLTLKSK